MDKIIQAFKKRHALNEFTNAMRLVNGKGDECDGLIIDCYGSHAVIYIYQARWLNQIDAIKQILIKVCSATYIIVKDRSQSATSKADDIKSRLIYGDGPSTTIVHEYGLSFEVDVNDGLNAGLFLDMRANRHAVGKLCKGKKVLNGFAYTCAFGVHARANGAREVVNVDVSKSYLNRGQVNYALNKLPIGQGEFLRYDAVKFLTNCVKKANIFDIIVLDPPSFARFEGNTFQVKRDLSDLVKYAIECLNPKGLLFVSTNCSELTHQDLEAIVANRNVASIKRVMQDVDFRGSNTFKESYLVGVMVQFK